jgi:3-phenylpropionate/trans-cinnamate dioxygenase ferredoxin subunit
LAVIDNMSSEKVSEAGSVSGFEPRWYYADEEHNLKEGKLLRVEAGGKDVLLVKTEGRICALSNVCPHARCPMDRGRLEDFILTCLCHGRKFDIRTGECLNDSLKLRMFEWKIEGGSVGVKIE